MALTISLLPYSDQRKRIAGQLAAGTTQSTTSQDHQKTRVITITMMAKVHSLQGLYQQIPQQVTIKMDTYNSDAQVSIYIFSMFYRETDKNYEGIKRMIL